MGSGASSSKFNRRIYVRTHTGNIVTIEFSSNCTTQDLKDLLTTAAGLSKWTTITLKNSAGSLVPISPAIPSNKPLTSYQLNVVSENREYELLKANIGEGSFFEQFANRFMERLNTLEKKFHDIKGDDEMLRKTTKKRKGTLMQSIDKIEEQFLRREIPNYNKYVLTQDTINYLKRPTFNIWHWETNEMLSLLEHMFHELDLTKELAINPITLRKWLLAIQDNYRDNPFHNFRHGFCVTQMMYGMINLCKLTEMFSKLDLVMLLTASVCHDLDHPGFNNSYQINARTELALRYNDKSPLENHHCAVAFQILSNPDTNIFENFTSENFKKVRAGIIELILATDMARHMELVEHFKQLLAKGYDNRSEDDRRKLKVMLIKCCDVSNEVRPMEVSEPWVDCLLEEYFMQSDKEKKEGLPVAPFMDREKVTKPTAQIGFIKFVLIPIFELVNKVLPEIEDAMIKPLRHSLQHYEMLKMKQDEDPPQQEEEESSPKPDVKVINVNAAKSEDKSDFNINIDDESEEKLESAQ